MEPQTYVWLRTTFYSSLNLSRLSRVPAACSVLSGWCAFSPWAKSTSSRRLGKAQALQLPSEFSSARCTVGTTLLGVNRTRRTRHFKESIKFIHECRLQGEGCLVHCLAGVSRSVTLVVAYIMTVTNFGWEDALHTVRAGRSCANPNLGFQRQLQEFEELQVHQFRQWLQEEYGESPLQDAEEARTILGKYKEQRRVEPPPGTRRWAGLRGPPPLAYDSCTPET
ncbi:dual specificity protein phosphatase 22 isoform X1 [Moschus berezovskii]|uniref:dual specificity protein phosphatase 22 isoform X1 n=1 Tax=Moschus berezovskii TaxID=68408 RepID=UPI002443C9CD|nr:dual specificity protein phosphatase 22 isoform X1 [Moschus berezovskii]